MKTVRIGGASSFYADSIMAVSQLLKAEPAPAYLMFDFMSEGTIGMMSQARAAEAGGGYMSDIITFHIAPNLQHIIDKKVKLIANAGGLNPKGCAEAIEAFLKERGATLKVGYVEGDDLLARGDELRDTGTTDMFSGAAFPETIKSANVYLGAFPIAQALAAGADIIVTGRCADSSLGLGALIHEFGWGPEDWDKLAAGTVVGHLLECGCQVTGGTFTDWEDVPGWEDMGYPIADVSEDGSCVISKVDGTGGLISVGSVAEQLLYEVSDPQAYIVPDVVCDFSQIRIEQVGDNRVSVSGTRGYPATDSYKGVASSNAGWRGTYSQGILGIDAVRKAERQGAALIERGRMLLRGRNMGDYLRTDVDVVGAESSYGPKSEARGVREVLMRASVDHEDQAAVGLFVRDSIAATSSMTAGASAMILTAVTQLTKLFIFLTPKRGIPVTVTVAGKSALSPQYEGQRFDPATLIRPPQPTPPATDAVMTDVPLIRLAWARSGDKGNLFNVGVIARRSEYLPYIRASLTPERFGECYAHLYKDGATPRVSAFDVPGFSAINYIAHDSMDGGISMSPRIDNGAKGMAQQLLQTTVRMPESLLA